MNLKLLGLLSFLLACLGSGYVGYQIASTSYELEISHIREQSKEQEALALQNKNEAENVYSKALITTQSKIAISNDRITATFRDLNSWADSNIVTDNSISLHNSQDNTSRNSDMSSTATTAGAVSDCKCRCDGKDAAKLRRLYQEQLIVARDCDITATHYNALIEFYRSISTP